MPNLPSTNQTMGKAAKNYAKLDIAALCPRPALPAPPQRASCAPPVVYTPNPSPMRQPSRALKSSHFEKSENLHEKSTSHVTELQGC